MNIYKPPMNIYKPPMNIYKYLQIPTNTYKCLSGQVWNVQNPPGDGRLLLRLLQARTGAFVSREADMGSFQNNHISDGLFSEHADGERRGSSAAIGDIAMGRVVLSPSALRHAPRRSFAVGML